jgi:hypothetical protein
MIKTGIVISIMNRKAGIMTSSGEFVYIKTSKILPKVGEIHTGELCRKNLLIYKYTLIAASLMFIFISSIGTYSYYTPVTTVVLSINPSVSIEANRWNKIVSSKALNSDGLLILNNIKLKYKSIDDGLELLVKEAKTENFINDTYINDRKIINIEFKSNKARSIDISDFKNIIDSNKLSININSSLGTSRNIDITANNKKIDTSNFNNGSYKKKDSTENSNGKNNPLKKPLINTNTNINEKKLYEIKKELKKSTNPIINKDTESQNKNQNNDSSSTIIKADVPSTKKKLQDGRDKNIRNVEINNGDNKTEKNSNK